MALFGSPPGKGGAVSLSPPAQRGAPSSSLIDSSAVGGLTGDAVAEWLLSQKYHLAALELHQELLEGNNGVHTVARLNSFFNSADAFAALTKSTEARSKQNDANGAYGREGGSRAFRCHQEGQHRTRVRRHT